MRVCVLYSGGKDSNLALVEAARCHDVVCLITLLPRSSESWLFHYPNVHLTKLQAEALNLPLLVEHSPDDEMGSLEALEHVLRRAIEAYQVEGVVTGAVKSTYQARRFGRICAKLGLECINPLWGRDEISLLEKVVEEGIEAIFTRIAGYPLSKSLLGRRIDYSVIELLKKIRRFVNPSGEGGEYETLVLDSPLFRKKLKIVKCRIEGSDYDATLVVEEAILVAKPSSPGDRS